MTQGFIGELVEVTYMGKTFPAKISGIHETRTSGVGWTIEQQLRGKAVTVWLDCPCCSNTIRLDDSFIKKIGEIDGDVPSLQQEAGSDKPTHEQ